MASTGTRFVLALALIVLAALLLTSWPWLFAPESRPDDAPPTLAHDGSVATAAIAARPDTAPPAANEAAPVERQAAPTSAAAAATTGSLLVHVVWGDDKRQAAGIAVNLVRRRADALFDNLRGTSSAAGSALFEALAPGDVYPRVDRGEEVAWEKIVIVAGQRAEVTLEVRMGMNATGHVVEANGTAVAGADIVMSEYGGGTTQTMGRSGPDGAFLLRAIGTHCHLGARKEGYVPTSMRRFTAADGATVDFTIVITRGGAVLEGIVFDPDGRPVAGAVVLAGEREQKSHKLPDGVFAIAPQSEQLRTDAAGRFRFASVVPGKVPVAVRARGLAPWRDDEVEVRADRTTSLTIHLLAGVTLFGTVCDEAGAPLAKVKIEAGDAKSLSYLSGLSAADGTYRVDGFAAGSLKVQASDDEHGKTSTTLEVVAGEQHRWDPVLSVGLHVRGRVLDHFGAPVASVGVNGQVERGSRGRQWSDFEITGADGRFVLKNCLEGTSLRLSFGRKSSFPELVLTGVVPSAEELVVRLPKEAWVHIQGTVLGPDGAALPNVEAMTMMKASLGGATVGTVDSLTGAFRYGPLPPGTFSLRFATAGYAPIRIAERTLGPDAVWDLGTVRFEKGGTLVVQLIAATAAPLPRHSLSIFDTAGALVEGAVTQTGSWRTGQLPPGTYVLQTAGETLASRVEQFQIRADRETRLDVSVQPGIAASIECALPQGTQLQMVALVVRDANRAVAWRGDAYVRAGQNPTPTGVRQSTAQLALSPGDYTIEASSGDLCANGAISVGAPGPAKATLVLRKP